MSDETVAATAPVLPDWAGKIAAKQVSWGVGKLLAAKAAGLLSAPAIWTAINAAGDTLRPCGVTLHVEPSAIQAALPVALFAGLVAAHDYAKLKTGLTWL